MTPLLSLHLVLASLQKGPDPADVKPGLLGFIVFVALAVAVTLLWFSMRRHLRKVDFEERDPSATRNEGDGN
jgi:hypothetical protein